MNKRVRMFVLVGAALVAAPFVTFALSDKAEFIAGGALMNAGYRLQDHLHNFDLDHDQDISPQAVWSEVANQNRLAASVRHYFPRAPHHPVAVLVVCMDNRLDTNELVGDTRKYYYIIRTAGSVLSEREQEMLELAVVNGVKVVLLTTHTGCAAEAAAADPAQRAAFPALAAAVDEREKRIQQFMARPVIAAKLASGELLIQRMLIDTDTDELLPSPPVPAPAAQDPAPPAAAEAETDDATPEAAH